MSEARKRAKRLQENYADSQDPLQWFEALYREASRNTKCIPWADLAANVNLVEWLDRRPIRGGTALVVGCGLGDDAEELARRGLAVTAFDLSAEAIGWCRERFPGSPVNYQVADLLNPEEGWRARFNLVVESYTLQVLPSAFRPAALRAMAGCVAKAGELLVITRGREENEASAGPPWPLPRLEFALLQDAGLRESEFEDYLDREDPPVRRFRILYRR